MQQVNTGTAYLFWFLWFFGICGGQRIYTGKIGSGLLYLFTFGLLGFGQFVDLFLIPEMVEYRNNYLKGKYGDPNQISPSVTVDVGRVPQQNFQPRAAATNTMTPMQRLLRAAKDNGGTLSIAQVALYTQLEPEEVRKLLQDAQRFGYAEVSNDPTTGSIRYHFDV